MRNRRPGPPAKDKVFKKTALAAAISGAMPLFVATDVSSAETVIEEVVVTGIRASLQRAQDVKRDSNGVLDAIAAEDLGKFPDLNVAESLQRISGVAIDRSGGEGQAVTVRGLGPQFNAVLVNGRQLATDSGGREFNFDVLAAEQISGADIFKSSVAWLQDGGIGSAINVKMARPFDLPGLQIVGSVKGMYESLSEETSPSGSFYISNTFNDDRIGVSLAVSHQERDVQINRIETAGWRPGQTISNRDDGVLFTNAFVPRNWDQIVDTQERTRTNANLVFQFAPSDDLTITLDGFVSRFEVDSLVTDLASWFEPDRVGSATIDDATRTLLTFTQGIDLHQGSGNPATDFVSHTRNSRDVNNDGAGLNIEWTINDRLSASFDFSTSSAENDRAGKDRFNVIGIINNYQFDGGGGSSPTVQHDGFSGGSLPDINLNRLHYNERGNRPTDTDEITELKADFEYFPDAGMVSSVRFGAYSQSREKEAFQIFANQCAFCGYGEVAPVDTLNIRPFTANNFFSGLIDTFYTYDGDAYVQFLADSGNPIQPTLQNNRYSIDEDIQSVYVDVTFDLNWGEMPVTVNTGLRYSETDISVGAVQSFISDVVPTTDLTLFSNRFGPATDFDEGTDYSDVLPNISIKLDLLDDMVVRFAAYKSITRPTMSELSPATTFNEPRRQNLTASGGNPALEPFSATNFDIAYEWYYDDSSVFSIAYFDKDIEDFIINLTAPETYTLTDRSSADGFRCTASLCAPGGSLDAANPGFDVVANTEELNGETEVYTVSRPRNGESATVDGFEVAITHVFDNGFGISANATFVDSDAMLDANVTQSFALEGIGDSQNLILFYEADRWQARIAYNNREAFLRNVDNGFNGEPVNTEEFGQVDIRVSYDYNDNLTVFFEGINITEEELYQTGRFANQAYNIEDNGSRFAIGIRGKW